MSGGEAAEIVEEVLSELLTRISLCYSPQPLPLALETEHPPQPLPLETEHPPQPLPLETEHPLLDLCTLSRELCELLKSYSLRTVTGAKVEVCQIKSLEQKASGNVV